MQDENINMDKYISIIEDGIQLLGIDPMTARSPEKGIWNLHRGSANIRMFMRRSRSHAGDRDVLVMISQLMPVPTNNKIEFYEELLRLNYQFISEKFSVNDGAVYLSSARFAQGMGSGEVVAMLDSLSYIADQLDDQLIQKYS